MLVPDPCSETTFETESHLSARRSSQQSIWNTQPTYFQILRLRIYQQFLTNLKPSISAGIRALSITSPIVLAFLWGEWGMRGGKKKTCKGQEEKLFHWYLSNRITERSFRNQGIIVVNVSMQKWVQHPLILIECTVYAYVRWSWNT